MRFRWDCMRGSRGDELDTGAVGRAGGGGKRVNSDEVVVFRRPWTERRMGFQKWRRVQHHRSESSKGDILMNEYMVVMCFGSVGVSVLSSIEFDVKKPEWC